MNPKYDRRHAPTEETLLLPSHPPSPRHTVPPRASVIRRTTAEGVALRARGYDFPAKIDVSAEEEADASARAPRSAIRYTTQQPVPVSAAYDTHYGRRWRLPALRPSLMVVAGMLLALALVGGGTKAISIASGIDQRWNYGPTPTFQVDQAVGHNGDSLAHPSHFIATDDGGRIYIVEIAPDGMKSQFYSFDSITGVGDNPPPVTLSFVTDPQSGRLDMEIHVEGSTLLCVNDGNKFDSPSL